jgi:RNA polymerase sigma factor (sigma-70 family)
MEDLYIRQILNGDIGRFSYFVDAYKDMAFTIASRIVNNKEDAEEVVQDAFVKAYTSLSTFRQNAKFSTWLYKIVVNASLSRTRKKVFYTNEHDAAAIEEIAEEGIESAYAKLSHADQKKMINEALDEMNVEDRLLLTLSYLEELSPDEIMEVTGIPKENSKVKLHRAKKKMYLLLEKKFGSGIQYLV